MQREGYQRVEKRALLDEVVVVTDFPRKVAIRLLRRAPRRRRRSEPVAPGIYRPDLTRAAAVLWRATGSIGARRLHPFVSELAGRLTHCDEDDARPGFCEVDLVAHCGSRQWPVPMSSERSQHKAR